MHEPHREESDRMDQRVVTFRLPNLPQAQMRLGALLALGFAAFLIGLLLVGGDDKGSQSAGNASVSGVSEAELRAFAASSPTPVYWAGPRAGQTYELSRTTDGRVYVRYLPAGVKVGDPRPRFLTVGTYPVANAFSGLKRISRAPGASTRPLPRGGMAVLNPATPSVYFGYPGAKYQVEVFAPSAASARRLVFEGQIVPVR